MSKVASIAIRACLAGVEKARTLLEGTGPAGNSGAGALTASIGATHQSLHRDTWGGIPNRIVLFVALDEVEDGDAGATVFGADRSDNIKPELAACVALSPTTSLLHFGAKKTSGVEHRALLYCAGRAGAGRRRAGRPHKKSPALVAAPRVDAAALADLASFTTCTAQIRRGVASRRTEEAARPYRRELDEELGRARALRRLGRSEAAAETERARLRLPTFMAGIGPRGARRARPGSVAALAALLDWGMEGGAPRRPPVERCRRGEWYGKFFRDCGADRGLG